MSQEDEMVGWRRETVNRISRVPGGRIYLIQIAYNPLYVNPADQLKERIFKTMMIITGIYDYVVMAESGVKRGGGIIFKQKL